MKNVIIALTLTLFTVSCLSQQPPAEPKAPKAAAAPNAPTPPPKPAPVERRNIEEQQREVAKNLSKVASDLDKMEYYNSDAFALVEESSLTRTLVIPQDGNDTKGIAETEDDLNVMAHILEKASASREERNARSMGIFFRSPFGGSSSPRNLYLEGYGAVFFLNVNFSLAPAPAKSDDSDAKEEQVNEWDEAKREMSNRRSGGGFGYSSGGGGSGGTTIRKGPPAPVVEYDADKVETLKRNVSQALKNATHIRKLKSDEYVTVVVSGKGGSVTKIQRTRSGVSSSSSSSSTSSVPDKLIIRAKKVDIEAFDTNALAYEDFRKKVAIFLN